MFRVLRVKKQPDKYAPDVGALSVDWLARSPNTPITLRQMNQLPESAKRRAYRALVPPDLLSRYGIHPVTWQGPDGDWHVELSAHEGTSEVHITCRKSASPSDQFLTLDLEDTALNGINLNFLLLQDPDSPRFSTDQDEQGAPTLFGTVRRNLQAEEQAMRAGLAPAQVQKGLAASRLVLQHLEAFLVISGHAAYTLEPLTYVSAWLFERRGFAYVRGHKLMDDIHTQFQPGGRLHEALDGTTPFRQPDQWRTVRGRAWAIHDGILDALGVQWDGLRMIKQVGRHAGVETFPDAAY